MTAKRVSFSTKESSVEDFKTFWPVVFNQSNPSAHIYVERQEGLFASVNSCAIGTMTINFWTINGIGFERTRRDCVQAPNDNFGLYYVRSGRSIFNQNGRTIVPEVGDCLLINMDEPLSHLKCANFHMIVLQIPSGRIRSIIPIPDKMTAKVFERDSKWVAALAATMNALTPDIADFPTTTQNNLLEHICCLLSLAVNSKDLLLKNDKLSMLQRFRQTIHERYFEHDLSPASIAAEHGVSTRTLYSVFASAQTSFRNELLTVRMGNAKHLLDNPRFDIKSIAEIGQLVSFLHPSHFTTCFTKCFGITPSSYRMRRQLHTPNATQQEQFINVLNAAKKNG